MPQRTSSRAASHNAQKRINETYKGTFSLGLKLVGRLIAIAWPDDGKYYNARVTDYQADMDMHILCYVDNEGELSVESVDLKNRKRHWYHVSEKLDPLIGKRILIDPVPGEGKQQEDFKTACIVSSAKVPQAESGEGHSTHEKSKRGATIVHTLLFVQDSFVVRVDLSRHVFRFIDPGQK